MWLLPSASCFRPSGSKLSRHCILARHVVIQYRTGVGVGEMRFVNSSELGRLRIQYERITMYKITVPSVGSCMTMRCRPDDRSTSMLRQAVKAEAIRLGVDPTMFNLHSLRIGGAYALRATGAPMSMILFMGRWK